MVLREGAVRSTQLAVYGQGLTVHEQLGALYMCKWQTVIQLSLNTISLFYGWSNFEAGLLCAMAHHPHLIHDIIVGIHALAEHDKKEKAALTKEDLKQTETINVNGEAEAFHMKDYAPKAFHHIRTLCGISQSAYLVRAIYVIIKRGKFEKKTKSRKQSPFPFISMVCMKMSLTTKFLLPILQCRRSHACAANCLLQIGLVATAQR